MISPLRRKRPTTAPSITANHLSRPIIRAVTRAVTCALISTAFAIAPATADHGTNQVRSNPLRSSPVRNRAAVYRPNPIRNQPFRPVVRAISRPTEPLDAITRPIRTAGFEQPLEPRRFTLAQQPQDETKNSEDDDAEDGFGLLPDVSEQATPGELPEEIPDDRPDELLDELPGEDSNDLLDDLDDDLNDDDLNDLFRDPPLRPGQVDESPDDDPSDPGDELSPFGDDSDPPNGDDESDTDPGDDSSEEDVDDETKHQRACQRDIRRLHQAKISQISLDIRPKGRAGERYPRQCELDVNEMALPHFRGGEPLHVAWTASGSCHKPLYFEEKGLERYGQTSGPLTQPILSAAHFFGSIPLLPYKIGLRAPNECVYALGHYRPGNCAPHYIPAIPFTWRAGLFQAGATVGAAYLVP